MHRMTYSSVHLCNPPEAISDGRLNPATDTSLLLAAYRGGSHLTSDIHTSCNLHVCRLQSDTLVAKNYLNEKELSRLNRLVTMFIDYAELMAEDEQLMSMQDWLDETDRFLTNNRRKVLDGKGRISREAAEKKVGAIYNEFRKKQDLEYISEFDRQTEKYLKGE